MPLSVLFWMIYVITLLFCLWSNYEAGQPLWLKRAGSFVVLWILVGILGWRVFGHLVN
jgi:hypothetical protein